MYIYYCIYLLLLYFCSTHQCDIQTLVSTIIHPLLATPIRFLSICAWLSGWFVHSGAGTSPLGAGDMIRPGHHKTCDWLAGDVPTQMIQIIQYIYLSSVCHRSRPANNRKCKRAHSIKCWTDILDLFAAASVEWKLQILQETTHIMANVYYLTIYVCIFIISWKSI